MQPTQLGPYKIRSRLGRGGMGAVYEAEEGAGGRLVAVKTLAAHFGDDAGLRRRFEGEIETLKALRHPGIVQLLAFGEEDGIPYFAMELVPGKSLDQELRAGRLFTWRETVPTSASPGCSATPARRSPAPSWAPRSSWPPSRPRASTWTTGPTSTPWAS
jgi:serine/threonine protein kinase